MPDVGEEPAGRRSAGSWKKVLYQKRDEPDNYVPPEFFLAAIEKNKNLHRYTLAECVRGACQVSLQVSSVLLFWLAYHFMLPSDDSRRRNGGGGAPVWSPEALFSSDYLVQVAAGNGSSSLIAGACLTLAVAVSAAASFTQAGQTVLVFVGFGLGLAPVLHRLTESISTDTIHSTAASMLLLHLVFHNYGLRSSVVSDALSFNAGIFAGVCLASRLPSGWHAFYLLSLAAAAFVLFPVARRWLTECHLMVNLAATLAASSTALGCSLYLDMYLVGAITVAASLAITLAFPALFVHWQSYKDTIHGPWDEAVPKL